ncbi:MAG TPA: PfkB family carbohydrate kinase, partial [Candidatus Binataceae bacterium]|nr:PfkB family carbohydrate kinase [Candidatus Binataceae bacterium]
PVLRLNRSEERLGNAAFVAASIRALGGRARLLSVTGADSDGRVIRHMAEGLGIGCDSLLAESGRSTIVKERLLGAVQSAERGIQQMLRVDREDLKPLQANTERALLRRLKDEIKATQGVLVCDINKGLLTQALLKEIIETAKRENKPVIIDPRRTTDFSIYRGATVLSPNRAETEQATGLSLAVSRNWTVAAKKLIHDFNLNTSLITLDRDGMMLAERNGTAVHLETTPREVYDVTGAGDVVLAVFGLFSTAGLPAADAAALANVAASLEVARQGAATISQDDLVAALQGEQHRSDSKILSLPELERKIGTLCGRRICFTDGSFAYWSAKHVRSLEFARAQADLLIVGLQSNSIGSEDSVPLERSTMERAQILAALEAVNFVVIFDTPSAVEVVRTIRPDVLVIASDLAEADHEAGECVRSYGGRIVTGNVMPAAMSTPAALEHDRIVNGPVQYGSGEPSRAPLSEYKPQFERP